MPRPAGSAHGGIRRVIAEAQTSRSRAQALADQPAALLFYELHRLGVQVVMITGDAKPIAEAAASLGIDEVFGEVVPEDEDAAVTELPRPRPAGGHGR